MALIRPAPTVVVAALCAAGLSLTTTARAETVQLPAAADNTLIQDDLGTLSNGAGSHLFVGTTNQGTLRRGLIRFDLSSIPAGATITGATLTLHMSRSAASGEFVSLHTVAQGWGEAGSNSNAMGGGGGALAQPGDATWLNTFFPGGPTPGLWTTPGGDFNQTASATIIVGGVGFYTWGGTGLVGDVQRWLSDPSQNFGWLIQGNELDPQSAKRFDSRENETVSNRPSLEVTYTIPSPGVAACLVLAGLCAQSRRRAEPRDRAPRWRC